jgi:hypothetical protein
MSGIKHKGRDKPAFLSRRYFMTAHLTGTLLNGTRCVLFAVESITPGAATRYEKGRPRKDAPNRFRLTAKRRVYVLALALIFLMSS